MSSAQEWELETGMGTWTNGCVRLLYTVCVRLWNASLRLVPVEDWWACQLKTSACVGLRYMNLKLMPV